LAGGQRKIVLIAGGDGKGADFSSLADLVRENVKAITLIGKDAEKIAQVCAPLVPVERCTTLQEAVEKAAQYAQPGDTVLLSPACASLDMFKNYEDRGEQFRVIAERLCQS
jgi:UDP-N-acetylmuramoylalanine--D-glutamate ligase